MTPNDEHTTLRQIKGKIQQFVRARKWEQYHNPKDLAEAICIEAAELLQIFQWVTASEASSWKNVPSKVNKIKDELADDFIYCFSMANVLDIDVSEIIQQKLSKNEAKYPVDKYFGRARLE